MKAERTPAKRAHIKLLWGHAATGNAKNFCKKYINTLKLNIYKTIEMNFATNSTEYTSEINCLTGP